MLFHPESGNTHLLDLVASIGLECLDASALDRHELCQKMAERLDTEEDEDLTQYVDALVARLDKLGILETVERPDP